MIIKDSVYDIVYNLLFLCSKIEFLFSICMIHFFVDIIIVESCSKRLDDMQVSELADILVASAKQEIECDSILKHVLNLEDSCFIELGPDDLAKLVFSMGLSAKKSGLIRQRVQGHLTDDLTFVEAYTRITGH